MNESTSPDAKGEEYSDSKSVFGVEMSGEEYLWFSVGCGSFLFGIFLMVYSAVTSFPNGVGLGLLIAVSAAIGVESNLEDETTEDLDEKLIRWAESFDEKSQEWAEKQEQDQSDGPTKSICRECHEEVSPGVNRCPNCGWKPNERGWVWGLATGAMILNPIGWVMGAKGAQDNHKAKKGVTKEVHEDQVPQGGGSQQEPTQEVNPTDSLKRLHDLKEQGVITEREFEEKKGELLEQI